MCRGLFLDTFGAGPIVSLGLAFIFGHQAAASFLVTASPTFNALQERYAFLGLGNEAVAHQAVYLGR